jgi:hypothetical protein
MGLRLLLAIPTRPATIPAAYPPFEIRSKIKKKKESALNFARSNA